MSNVNENSYSCPRCTVGRCMPQTTTFVDVIDQQLLCVPDMMVYVCDICHFAEFELDALESLWEALQIDEITDRIIASSGHNPPSPIVD